VPVAVVAVVAAFGAAFALGGKEAAPTEQQRAATALAGREPPSMGGVALTVQSILTELEEALAGATFDGSAIDDAVLAEAEAAIAPYPEYAYHRYVRNAIAATRLAKRGGSRALAIQARAIATGVSEALRIDFLLLQEARRAGTELPVPTWGAPDGARAGTPNPPADLGIE
jgi:hypothetical protein